MPSELFEGNYTCRRREKECIIGEVGLQLGLRQFKFQRGQGKVWLLAKTEVTQAVLEKSGARPEQELAEEVGVWVRGTLLTDYEGCFVSGADGGGVRVAVFTGLPRC